jgi:TolA-binding protein
LCQISFRKQISEIPERTQAYQKEFQQLTLAHQERVALGHELAKQRRTRESDVEMMRAKLSRLKDQLMTVKTNKEYQAILQQIQDWAARTAGVSILIRDIDGFPVTSPSMSNDFCNLVSGEEHLNAECRQSNIDRMKNSARRLCGIES